MNWSSNLRRHEKFKHNPNDLRKHEKAMHNPSLTEYLTTIDIDALNRAFCKLIGNTKEISLSSFYFKKQTLEKKNLFSTYGISC